jgi:hypothetical protein
MRHSLAYNSSTMLQAFLYLLLLLLFFITTIKPRRRNGRCSSEYLVFSESYEDEIDKCISLPLIIPELYEV